MKYLLSLLLWSALFSDPYKVIGYDSNWKLPLIALESIDHSQFSTTSRQYRDQTRYHLSSAQHNLFLKYWSSGYIDRDRFVHALDVDFYDNIAQIKGVIVDRTGEVRGYLQPLYRPLNRPEIKLKCGRRPLYPLYSIRLQNKKFQHYVAEIIVRSLKKECIYYDLSSSNFMWDGTRYWLIDLESVCSVDEFASDPRAEGYLSVCPREYRQFIEKSIEKRKTSLPESIARARWFIAVEQKSL